MWPPPALPGNREGDVETSAAISTGATKSVVVEAVMLIALPAIAGGNLFCNIGYIQALVEVMPIHGYAIL